MDRSTCFLRRSLLALMCLALLLCGVHGRCADKQPTSPQELHALQVSRHVWALSNTGKPSDVAEAAKALTEIRVQAGSPAYQVVELLKCRLYYRSRLAMKAQMGFLLGLVDSVSVAPECILGLVELNKNDVHVRTTIEACMARLLPLSGWGQQSNARESKSWADIKPPRPDIPVVNVKKLIAIAETFQKAALHKEAWKAFVEAVYAGAPSWIEGLPREEAWLSPDRAELWRQAAENAWKAGEHALAYDYLAKCAVFGSEAQFDEAKETVKKWNAGKGKEAEPEISKAQRQKALKEVIRLYAELNAHPRALDLIQTYRDWLDNPDELYAEYSKQWRAALKSYGRASESVVVFGVKMTDAVDPATIRIPFGCSPESVKEVKAKLAQILETKK